MPPRPRGPSAWILTSISLLVPAADRDRWLEEWRSELAALQRRGSGPSPLLFALGAIPHSLWERKEWAVTVLLQDVRFAMRVLVRSPAFTSLALLTVALGVGASTTIFTLVNATLLRPPDGIRDPGRVVQIGRQNEGGFDNLAYPHLRAFDRQVGALAGVAAYSAESLLVGRGAETQVLTGALVSGNYFTVLGVTPADGRLLSTADALPGAADPVAVVSARLAAERFGGGAAAVGADLYVNGRDYTVIGVADPAFRGTDVTTPATDVWIPLSLAAAILGDSYADFDQPGLSWLWAVGRLRDDATLAQARTQVQAVYERSYEQAWGEKPDRGTEVVSGPGLRPDEREFLRTLTSLLFAVVAVVLLVASANLGNLMLARATVRIRELGVRVALGASRARLVRQMVTESLLVALAGGLLAVLATVWTAGLLPAFLPWSLGVGFDPDLRVLGFGLLCAALAGTVFGLVPALRVSRRDVTDALKEGARQVSGGGHLLRRGLVIGQLALSFLLLACAGLLVQSLLQSRNADPGYRTRDVLVASLNLDLAGYDEAEGRQLRQLLAERAAALPGVERAALGSNVPFGGWSRESMMLPEPPVDGPPFVQLDSTVVGRGYFETLGIPVLRGTAFPADGPQPAADELVLSESAARLLFPDGDALGAVLRQPVPPDAPGGEPGMTSIRIVGVVADVHNRSLRQQPAPSMYKPAAARYSGRTALFLRAAGSPEALTRSLRALVADLDPDLALLSVDTLHARMGRSLTDTLLVGRLAGAFGLLAVLLAAVGLYGVVAYLTSRRVHEVGIRMALGAGRASVLGLVVRQGLVLGVVGIAVGVALAIPVTGALRSLLYGVSPRDPVVLAASALLLLGIAALASALPARRATRVDPASALRES